MSAAIDRRSNEILSGITKPNDYEVDPHHYAILYYVRFACALGLNMAQGYSHRASICLSTSPSFARVEFKPVRFGITPIREVFRCRFYI